MLCNTAQYTKVYEIGPSSRVVREAALGRRGWARKSTVRTLLAPSARTTLLGRPFGRVEGAIRHRQDDLLGRSEGGVV